MRSIKKIIKKSIGTKDIQKAVGAFLYSKGYSPIVFNFLFDTGHECDVLGVSRAGYMYEYEVKISRADFKKDFEKRYKHNNMAARKSLFSNGRYVCPNYFYYVVPEGLVSIEEIPEYAGLIQIDPFSIQFIEAKSPAKIHAHKADDRMIKKIAHSLSCKFIFSDVTINQGPLIKDESQLFLF